MRIAVIVSTYNSKLTLEKVLHGYRMQTVPPAELIVADDGSSDGTDEVVASAAKQSHFPMQYAWQEDLGFRASRIRNEAVKKSDSEYLIFTDGDCVPHPRFIQDHDCIARPQTFVQGRRMLASQRLSLNLTSGSALDAFRISLRGELSGWYHLLPVPGFCVVKKTIKGIKSCNLGVYRKDLFAVNGFNEDFVGWGREDSELAVRLMRYGLVRRDAVFCALVIHLWHEQSSRQSLTRNDKLLESMIRSGCRQCRNGLVKIADDQQIC